MEIPPTERKAATRKISSALYYVTIGCAVIGAIALGVKLIIYSFVIVLALVDAPPSSVFDILIRFFSIIWSLNATLLEFIGVLLISIVIVRMLYNRRLYTLSDIVAVVLLLLAIPFARQEVYLDTIGMLPPLFGNGVDIWTYKTLSENPRIQSQYSLDKNHVYCSK
jgi:hypothetical protein